MLLCSTASASSAKSADVISAALQEVGYTEGANEYSKYGEWYGLAHSYWCDMFVSWCAMTGNIPTSKFPRQCSCTAHVNLFSKQGWYQKSAARGGSYIPQQGDEIFFYNYIKYPSGSVKNHTGLVLYVEDGYVYTIEGNALANRLDRPYSEVALQRVGSLEPPDYVTVNRYPLDAPHIHGYGVPAYDDRTPLELSGFVDLGRHQESGSVFQSVVDAGLMSPTSSHTFSPNHGMTRGDFLMMTMDFFGLLGCSPETAAFDDVTPGSAYFAAVMSARSAGIVNGAVENLFLPDLYVSPDAAGTILKRAMNYVGMEEQEFSFSTGDYSYILSSYTIRADIAKAFDALSQQLPLSEPFDGEIFLDGAAADWPARKLDGVCYVPADVIQQIDPALETTEPAEAAESTESTEPTEPAKAEETLPVPLGNTDRVLRMVVPVQSGETAVHMDGIIYRGAPYVPLQSLNSLIPVHMEWAQDGSSVNILTGNSGEAAEQ